VERPVLVRILGKARHVLLEPLHQFRLPHERGEAHKGRTLPKVRDNHPEGRWLPPHGLPEVPIRILLDVPGPLPELQAPREPVLSASWPRALDAHLHAAGPSELQALLRVEFAREARTLNVLHARPLCDGKRLLSQRAECAHSHRHVPEGLTRVPPEVEADRREHRFASGGLGRLPHADHAVIQFLLQLACVLLLRGRHRGLGLRRIFADLDLPDEGDALAEEADAQATLHPRLPPEAGGAFG
jgi:hypothetical protein